MEQQSVPMSVETWLFLAALTVANSHEYDLMDEFEIRLRELLQSSPPLAKA